LRVGREGIRYRRVLGKGFLCDGGEGVGGDKSGERDALEQFKAMLLKGGVAAQAESGK
jgi:hypothetical protein